MNAPPIFRPDRLPFVPTVGAVVGVWLALTPSLLPRPASFQGLLCAVAALLGYGLGALLRWAVPAAWQTVGPQRRRVAWIALSVVSAVGTLAMVVLHLRWQREMRSAIGVDQVGLGHPLIVLLVGVVLFGLLLILARALRAAGRSAGRQVGRVLPARFAALLGVALVTAGGYWLVNSLVVGTLVGRLDAVFMAVNDEFSTDRPAPESPHLSAGPGSLVGWDELGRQGRAFIMNAPTPEEISAVTGEQALQPVRAYVGVGTDREVDLREESQLAVAELERAGGFERQVVNVATGTGRGWINENQAQALEYMWGGDTATVSVQYSYLPSWMSFLVDQQRAQDAGRLLFEAVYARWLELPEPDRPLLVVSGESLGSFGGEAAFSGEQDIAARTDGALFVGPASNNRLWSQFTRERDRGTTQIEPIYQAGRTVRFSDDGIEWPGEGEWESPRVGYLQHANDPVTWWNWALAFSRPDWLVEERGRDVHHRVRWIPVVTMLQVAADQMVANDVPDGQGHQFGQAPVYAWAEILPPPGWTSADSDRVAAAIGATKSATD
ncbi:alpha/beta hydrolase [Nocardioides alcanivorans]|uniref:alpha/beta hydrolase n=1 Tax=Nocardioides alcanivorans TaxID=2897352 RepID=UPI001F2667A9|nr:alpha/beta-hydrolase family protein [Nocardioides alcanivorans]